MEVWQHPTYNVTFAPPFFFVHAESESPQCFSQCGVYTENGPPVPVLSGAGLYVQDDDHNEIFYMMVS